MYKNFNLTDEERQQTMEQHKSHGYKKPLNEKMFNDEGEQMMSYRQYQDYNKPLERDYEDMYNDEEEEDNDNDYYIDAPIGRRLKDGTMIRLRDAGGVEFGGQILDMVHYDEDEPKYKILPHGDSYDTYRYPHEVKIDRSYSPRLSEQRSKKSSLLNERIYDKEYDVVRGNPDFKTQTGRPIGDYVNKRNAAKQFQQDFQGEFPDPSKEARPYWEKDQARPSGDYAYEDSMDDKMLYSKEFKFKEREKKEQEEKINGVRIGLSDLSRGIKSVQKDLEDLFNESASGSSNKFSGLAVLMTSPLVKHYVDLYDSRYRGYNSYRDNLIKLTGEDMGNTESSKSFMEKLVTSYMGQK